MGGRAASGRRPAAGGGVFLPNGRNTPPYFQRNIPGGAASPQASCPSPLSKGRRLTPSAAPPFPGATLRRGLSCSFGAIHLHTSLVCGGDPVFPSRTLLETTQRGVLRSPPPFGIPLGGWNGRRGAKDEGRGAAGDSGPALLRQTRPEPDSPAPALAGDTLRGTGGYIGPLLRVSRQC